jgi:uncharacterized protein (DUF58 family)
VLPRDLIRRIRRLEIRTRKVVASVLAGQYHSVFKGRGMAFSEVRQYQPGDEIRIIDWNVTARMREPYVKVFTEERELTVVLVVDVSGSQSFGSVRSKAEVAAEVAAQIAFSAIANNDRVGLILFSDRVEKWVPPKKGRSHVLRVISEILTAKPQGRGTDLRAGLDTLSRVLKRKSVAFLISDFIAQGHEKSLQLASKRHDVIPIVIGDAFEKVFPRLGLVTMEDPETGELLVVDTNDSRVRDGYSRSVERQHEHRRRLFQKLELDTIELQTGADYAAALTRFFKMRARRLAA